MQFRILKTGRKALEIAERITGKSIYYDRQTPIKH